MFWCYFKSYFFLLPACLLMLSTACQKAVPEPVRNDEPSGEEVTEENVPAPDGFTGQKYGDWTYMIRTEVMDTYAAKNAISLLHKNLDQIDGLLPEKALSVMHKQPIWLEKNEREWAEWGMTRFLPDAFFEAVPFERLEIEFIDPDAPKKKNRDPRNAF